MDEKTIKEALLKGERVTLECKRAKAEVPKSVWATYSAFANTIGGLIRLTYDGLWENNLYQFFRIVSPKIQFDLPKPQNHGDRYLISNQ